MKTMSHQQYWLNKLCPGHFVSATFKSIQQISAISTIKLTLNLPPVSSIKIRLVMFSSRGGTVRVCLLASGSKGNSIFVEAGAVKVLIDAGLSARELLHRLAVIGVDGR